MNQTNTVVSIEGPAFFVNGEPTHKGRRWHDRAIEGLLFNARMANAIIDDENPTTQGAWEYIDGPFSAERNVSEFIDALPSYHAHGLDAVCVNLQGGSPQGYSWNQPWIMSGFESDGTLKKAYLDRLDRVVSACDAIGMVVILGLFYHRQSRIFADEAAVISAVSNTVDWLADRGARNVLLEIANQVDLPFPQKIIESTRCHELILLAQERSKGRFDTPSKRLLVSTSLLRQMPFSRNLMESCDFLLLHGNEVHHPIGIRLQVERNKQAPGYRGQPLIYNEDDHFDFDRLDNNMVAAVEEGASWGFFDYRGAGGVEQVEGFADGFQSLPIDWTISSSRKRGFFSLLKRITGGSQHML